MTFNFVLTTLYVFIRFGERLND